MLLFAFSSPSEQLEMVMISSAGVAAGSVISRLLCVEATSTRGGLLLRPSSCSSSLLWPSDEGRSIRGGGGTVVYSTCTSPLLSLSWLLDR